MPAAPPRRRSRRPAAVPPSAGRPGCAPAQPTPRARSRRPGALRRRRRRGPLTTRTTRSPPGRSTVTHTAAPGRVLARVGERLLHDPVGGPADRGVHGRAPSGAGGELARPCPACRDSSTSRARSSRPGCGPSGASSSTRRRAARRPSAAARRAPAGRRSARCTASCSTRLRVGGGHLDRAGLQHHEAHPVADGVVHLAGDAGALAEHGLAGHAARARPRRARPARAARRAAAARVRAQAPTRAGQHAPATAPPSAAATASSRGAAVPGLGDGDACRRRRRRPGPASGRRSGRPRSR